MVNQLLEDGIRHRRNLSTSLGYSSNMYGMTQSCGDNLARLLLYAQNVGDISDEYYPILTHRIESSNEGTEVAVTDVLVTRDMAFSPAGMVGNLTTTLGDHKAKSRP